MTNGGGCTCGATYEAECFCGAAWPYETPTSAQRIARLEAQLFELREQSARICEAPHFKQSVRHAMKERAAAIRLLPIGQKERLDTPNSSGMIPLS